MVARQAAAAERGAVPAEAYLAGYAAGLVLAAVLVLIGAVIGLVTLQRRGAKAEETKTPEPAPVPQNGVYGVRDN